MPRWPARASISYSRVNVGECDLVAKGLGLRRTRGFFYVGDGQFIPDWQTLPPVSDVQLRHLVALTGHALTYTCIPPGCGQHIGVDRDSDGVFDGDEIIAGSGPADPLSTP
jgi:hypothetical protein